MKLRDLARWLFFAAQPFYVVKNKAPDTSGVNQAAVETAALGREALQWFKTEYANTADERAAAEQRANAISDAQLASMNYALGQAKDAEAYNKSTFRPLEQRLVADAQTYDTAERRNSEAASAVAEVNRQVGAQRVATQQELARAGVSPESAKTQAIMDAGDINAAKAAAGADFTARKNVEQQGYARMADAASLGRNLPSQQATQQALSGTAGSGSLQASQQALQARMSGAGLMQAGFSSGIQGASTSGSLFGQATGLQNQARGQDLGVVTSMISALSDEDKKKDTNTPADPDEALEEINEVPVMDGWSYDPAKGGPDEGGRKHTGPMAADVQASMGDAVAPGGKVINLVDMNGKLLAGMQALTKRVEKVERRVKA